MSCCAGNIIDDGKKNIFEIEEGNAYGEVDDKILESEERCKNSQDISEFDIQPKQTIVSEDNFYQVLVSFGERGISVKISELIPLMRDVNHARFFYTYLGIASRLKFLNRIDRARFTEEALTEVAHNISDKSSFEMF